MSDYDDIYEILGEYWGEECRVPTLLIAAKCGGKGQGGGGGSGEGGSGEGGKVVPQNHSGATRCAQFLIRPV